jgi:hypothetical protein
LRTEIEAGDDAAFAQAAAWGHAAGGAAALDNDGADFAARSNAALFGAWLPGAMPAETILRAPPTSGYGPAQFLCV